ncbi:Uncharacterized protein TPAR_07233 [Tolypocladium paradoxum]|uniref:Aminoglycoside phosphotransferase domain-containing protein n=1 Tax=Tolypocladium paradoxum TaxID=94208 RepID=A0A2S4KQT6_9HYPO|nr:Uncharacterized protein TPAR_07233 [Tolypocladium paradoxum]
MERIHGDMFMRAATASRNGLGPFKTINEFHLWLREGLTPEQCPGLPDEQAWKSLVDTVPLQDKPWPPPVFTHGDVSPANMLIRGGKAVGIADWEFAGRYLGI